MKIIFASNSNFGTIVLKKLLENNITPSFLVVSKDKKSKRGLQLQSLPIKYFANEKNIEIQEINNLNDFHLIIEKEKPNLVVVTAIGMIIKKETLDLSFFLNIHPSLLPKYRGATPIQTAIINGDTEMGVSLLKMSHKIDSGPIISQKEINFDSKIDYRRAEEELALLGADLLVDCISQFPKEDLSFSLQDESQATYTEKFLKEDGKINWEEPAKLIERKIRALNPWPGTYCKLNDKYFKVLEADTQEQNENGPFGEPGKIYLGTNYTLAIQTGKDFLLIKKLQFEGRKATSSKDFLQGNINSIGQILS
jgi:methionyl-tRNA formyltransferase